MPDNNETNPQGSEKILEIERRERIKRLLGERFELGGHYRGREGEAYPRWKLLDATESGFVVLQGLNQSKLAQKLNARLEIPIRDFQERNAESSVSEVPVSAGETREEMKGPDTPEVEIQNQDIEALKNEKIQASLGSGFKFGQNVKAKRSDGTIEDDWKLVGSSGEIILIAKDDESGGLLTKGLTKEEFLGLNSPEQKGKAVEVLGDKEDDYILEPDKVNFRIQKELGKDFKRLQKVKIKNPDTGEVENDWEIVSVGLSGVRVRKSVEGGYRDFDVAKEEFLELNSQVIDTSDLAEQIDADIAGQILKDDPTAVNIESKTPEEVEQIEQNWAAKMWTAGASALKDKGSKLYGFVSRKVAETSGGGMAKFKNFELDPYYGMTEEQRVSLTDEQSKLLTDRVMKYGPAGRWHGGTTPAGDVIPPFEQEVGVTMHADNPEVANFINQSNAEIANIQETSTPKEKVSILRGLSGIGFTVQEWKARKMAGIIERVSGEKKDESKMNRGNLFMESWAEVYKKNADKAKKQKEELYKSGGLFKHSSGVATLVGNALLYARVFTDPFRSGLNPLRHVTAAAMFFGKTAEALKEAEMKVMSVETAIKDAEVAAAVAWDLYEKAKNNSADGEVSRKDLEKTYVKELPDEILHKLRNMSEDISIFRLLPQALVAMDIGISASYISGKLEKIEKSDLSAQEKESKKGEVALKHAKFLKEMERMIGEGGRISLLGYGARLLESAGKKVGTLMALETLATGVLYGKDALSALFEGDDDALEESKKMVAKAGGPGWVDKTTFEANSAESPDVGTIYSTTGIVDMPEVENAFIDTTPIAKAETDVPVVAPDTTTLKVVEERELTRNEAEEFTKNLYKGGKLKTGLPVAAVPTEPIPTKTWEMPKAVPAEPVSAVAPKVDLAQTMFENKNKELAEEFYRREQANKFELGDKEGVVIPIKRVETIVAQPEVTDTQGALDKSPIQPEAIVPKPTMTTPQSGETMVDVSTKDPNLYAEKVLVPEKENVFADEPFAPKVESVPATPTATETPVFEKSVPPPAPTFTDAQMARLMQDVEEEVKSDIKEIYHINWIDRWGVKDWQEARVISAKQFLQTFSDYKTEGPRNVYLEGSKDKHAKLFKHFEGLMNKTGVAPNDNETVEDFLKRLTLEEKKMMNVPLSKAIPQTSVEDLPIARRDIGEIKPTGVQVEEPVKSVVETPAPVVETESAQELDAAEFDRNAAAARGMDISKVAPEEPPLSEQLETAPLKETAINVPEKDGLYDMSTSEEQQLLEQVRREIASIALPKEPTAEEFAYDLNQKIVNSEAVEEAVGLGLEKELDALSAGAVKTQLDEIYGQKSTLGLFGGVSGENSRYWKNVKDVNIKRFEDFYKRYGKDGAELTPFKNKENEKQYKLFQLIQKLRVESGTEPLLTETVSGYVRRSMKEALAKAHHLKR